MERRVGDFFEYAERDLWIADGVRYPWTDGEGLHESRATDSTSKSALYRVAIIEFKKKRRRKRKKKSAFICFVEFSCEMEIK